MSLRPPFKIMVVNGITIGQKKRYIAMLSEVHTSHGSIAAWILIWEFREFRPKWDCWLYGEKNPRLWPNERSSSSLDRKRKREKGGGGGHTYRCRPAMTSDDSNDQWWTKRQQRLILRVLSWMAGPSEIAGPTMEPPIKILGLFSFFCERRFLHGIYPWLFLREKCPPTQTPARQSWEWESNTRPWGGNPSLMPTHHHPDGENFLKHLKFYPTYIYPSKFYSK